LIGSDPKKPMSQDQASQDKAKLWAEMDAAEAAGNTATKVDDTPTEPAKEEPAKAAAQTDAPAQAAAATEQAAKDEDAYAGMSDAAKHELLGLKTMLTQATERLRNAEGRIGGLNSQLKQFMQAASSTRADGGDAPTREEIAKAQSDPAAMAKLREDYPEFGAAVKAALDEQVKALRAEMKGNAAAKPAPAGVTQADLASMRAEIAVESRHPGWQERVKTPAFVGWLTSQPREVQMLAASDSPQDAIRLLDLETEARTKGSQQRNQRQESAAAIPSGRAASARHKPVESMNKEEYWRYLDEIDKQKG